MKKTFIYGLSTLAIASVMLTQVPIQAATTTTTTTKTYTKTMPHTKKTITGKTKKDLMKKETTVTTKTKRTQKEVPLDKGQKKY